MGKVFVNRAGLPNLYLYFIVIIITSRNQTLLQSMHKALHSKGDIDKKRKRKRSRQHWRLQRCRNRKNREIHLKNIKEKLITATSNSISNIKTKTTTKTGKKNLLHGDFKRQTVEIAYVKNWTWLRNGNLKKETEFILIEYKTRHDWVGMVIYLDMATEKKLSEKLNLFL